MSERWVAWRQQRQLLWPSAYGSSRPPPPHRATSRAAQPRTGSPPTPFPRIASVRHYWTAERMREAEPLDAPAGAGDEPSPLASAAAQPPDKETDPANDTTYPKRIHGRLFVTFAPDDASCSATVVRSFTRNLVLTAGHCVVSPTAAGPQWATNVAFVPGYRSNARPFRTYPATKLRAPGIWAFEGTSPSTSARSTSRPPRVARSRTRSAPAASLSTGLAATSRTSASRSSATRLTRRPSTTASA